MKINEIITEGLDRNALIDIARTIMQNCGPFLRQIDNKPISYGLFRGIIVPGNKFFTSMSCPVNRNPRDSNMSDHIIADAWFFKQTGIKFRSNAIFATGDDVESGTYGSVYRIFPIGNFSFCWSPNAKDMTNEVFSNFEVDDYSSERSRKAALIKELNALEYQTTDLKEAIISDNEIMINCKEAYVLRVNPESDDDVNVLRFIEDYRDRQLPQRPKSSISPNVAAIKKLALEIRNLQLSIKKQKEAMKSIEKAKKSLPSGESLDPVIQTNYQFFVSSVATDSVELIEKQEELERLQNES